MAAPLALAPLWGIAYSLLTMAFTTERADLRAMLTSCQRDSLDVAYSNVGTLPAIIKTESFSLISGPHEWMVPYKIRPDRATLIVSPKEAVQLVHYAPYIGDTKTTFVNEQTGSGACRYQLTVTWSDFSDVAHTLVKECACPT